jgi:hypothetical protein
MKTSLFVSAALFATSAFAGVHIENTSRDIKTKAPQGNIQTMLVQNGMLRMNHATGAVILKGSSLIMIDDKRQQYREMTKEDMKKMADQAGAAMKRMQEQMKNMKPEQRAMMEKMMGNKIPGGMGAMGGADKPDVWEAKNLNKTGNVEGRTCQVWNMSRNGALFEELCVVPYSSLPGKENLDKVFKDMAAAFADLGKASPNANETAKAFAQINGYPVRTRFYEGDGKFRPTETVLTKWVEESIPASTFEVPAGYKKMEMPTMPPP